MVKSKDALKFIDSMIGEDPEVQALVAAATLNHKLEIHFVPKKASKKATKKATKKVAA